MSSTTQVMPSHSQREQLGLLLGVVGMVIFGGTLPATRLAVSAIDPFALTALRAAMAGLCSLALLIALRRPLPPRALWPQLVIAMICVAILFPLLMSEGMLRVDAGAGTSIKLELWALSAAAFGRFVAAIPPPLSVLVL